MVTLDLAKGEWRLRGIGQTDWIPVSIPGEVHVALMEAGLIPDPFVADNELAVKWVARADWAFEGVIQVSEEMLSQDRVILSFDGLDTLAEISLNGTTLGHTRNAFRAYSWEVKKLLRPGANNVQVFFDSPVRYAEEKQAEKPLFSPEQSIQGGPHLRKAPCQWGWDWGPQLPPIGIWKQARFEGFSSAKLESVHLHQRHLFSGAFTISADVKISSWTDMPLQLCLTLRDPQGKTFATTCKVIDGSATAVLEIRDPVLWWPNGYGEQALYQAWVTVRTEDETVLDRREYQLGLRTLELRQETDKYGESFKFIVNGVPVFAKGANWIPPDTFPTRITFDKLDELLGDAAKANHNMIRVWGGGFYESEDFYDLCDRYGLLVWQDFIFSCSVYPLDDPDFVADIREEVKDNVERIRHRASLALWCGNNEMDLGWEEWGWSDGPYKKYREPYRRFFYETLPGWLASLDPDTPYWYSSPSSGVPFTNANSAEKGDSHYWEVWHGAKPFAAYREQFPRFMSEFGFQSLPPLKTISTYASEEHWNLTDYMIEHHQRNDYASALFMGQMALHFMMPADFPSLVYLTMVLQAEGIRFGVEHWRRNRHRVGGTLYWQLNDCWPVASWSSVDYYRRWKALHYASQRFYEPLLLSIEDNAATTEMKVHLTSDLLTDWGGVVVWKLVKLDGEVLAEGEMDLVTEPQSSILLIEKTFRDLSLAEKRETVFVAQLLKDGELLAQQLATFVRNKHLKLVNPRLNAYLTRGEGDLLTIEIVAEYLARFVELSLDDADVVFSDNYFDVLPGETVSITCRMPAGWTIDDFARSLTVFSLYDSFA